MSKKFSGRMFFKIYAELKQSQKSISFLQILVLSLKNWFGYRIQVNSLNRFVAIYCNLVLQSAFNCFT